MRFARLTAFGLAAALSLAAASPAFAACSVNPQGIGFGSYDSLAPTPLDGTGNINIACDTSTAFTVALGSGAGSIGSRHMTSGASELGYNLYTGASRLVVWGDGFSGSTVSATGTNVDLPVYGRVPARQNVPAASYADSVTVTVSF